MNQEKILKPAKKKKKRLHLQKSDIIYIWLLNTNYRR